MDEQFSDKPIVGFVKSSLDNSPNTEKKLKKLLIVIFILLLVTSGAVSYLAYKNFQLKEEIKGDKVTQNANNIGNLLDNNKTKVTSNIEKNNTECQQYKVIGAGPTQDDWDDALISDENSVKYVEYNLEKEKVCKWNIFTFTDKKNLKSYPTYYGTVSYTYLHKEGESKASFIFYDKDNNNLVVNLVIVDLHTKEIKKIPLEHFSQYNLYYGGLDVRLDIDKSLGTFIIISPIDFIGGCSGLCESFYTDKKKRWEEKNDIWITIIRTDGKYLKIKRKEFPFETSFNDFIVQDGKMIFKKNGEEVKVINLDILK